MGYYEGMFSKGYKHGYGVFKIDKKKYEGEFKQGKLNGIGKYTYNVKNRRREEVTYFG